MNYEIERGLRDKVDKWELHNVQNENRELKSKIHELENEIGYLVGTNSKIYHVLERLLNMLAEQPQFADISNEIYELRSSL